MFINAHGLDPGAHIDSGVCIVGAGAAGITLARTLARHGISTALLESGGLTPDADTQRLHDVVNLQPQYPFAMMRLRYFGGSTNHWGGMCRPLDEEDFLPRPWVTDSGWPIRRADLDPYYPEAMSILDLPPQLHAVSFEQLAQDTEHKPYLLGNEHAQFEPLVWFQSTPTRMNEKYRDEIGNSKRIYCFLHANATELVADDNGSRLRGVKARTLGGREFTFVATAYVLCAGGIENARLLLLSDATVKDGIGNGHDLVGRYLMEHQYIVPQPRLVVLPPHETWRFQEEDLCQRYRDDSPPGENDGFGLATRHSLRRKPGIKSDVFGFAIRPLLRRKLGLLNCAINASFPDETGDTSVPEAIRDLLAGSGAEVSPSAATPRARVYKLLPFGEPSPNRDSRVFLGRELDALGQRKTMVDLRIHEQDRRSIRVSLDLFAKAIGELGRGRVQVGEPDPALWTGGSHDMGTTRMADDPTGGVTDRNGKVHGIANLFVAGSSLFPTAGFANPTLTVVALTLRLTDRLTDIIRTPSTPLIR
jgi:choline dehydrogenase-like flavoprotein